MKQTRASGVLVHISSLPSPYGIGDFGPGAYAFADMLRAAEQRYWQILPLNPTSVVMGNSPYSSCSAFALNVLFVSPDLLLSDGWIAPEDVADAPAGDGRAVDYAAVTDFKSGLLRTAWQKFAASGKEAAAFRQFCVRQQAWLEDFALFVVLKKHFDDQSWADWPEPLRNRRRPALRQARAELRAEIEEQMFYQFLCWRQWLGLRRYCSGLKLQVIGDMPIYVTYDSVDVWTNPAQFKLDAGRKPTVVAGVPPDYFSATGQLWGNPVYDWRRMRRDGFTWWLQRLRHNFQLYDWVRIDHFRGFVDYWEIPSGETTAVNGRWQNAPAEDFLNAVYAAFPRRRILAEDLGIISDAVRRVIAEFDIPGMKILLFAFYEDKPDHPYLPHMYAAHSVVYTGTHDNNTTRGWFETETGPQDRERLNRYAGAAVCADTVHWTLIEMALRSKAFMALIPLPDILGLDGRHRMNVPGVGQGNWVWRITPEMLDTAALRRLGELTRQTGRAV